MTADDSTEVTETTSPGYGDHVEQWLERLCDGKRLAPPEDAGIWYVLADYREHIHTGVPLSRDVRDDDQPEFARHGPAYTAYADDALENLRAALARARVDGVITRTEWHALTLVPIGQGDAVAQAAVNVLAAITDVEERT